MIKGMLKLLYYPLKLFGGKDVAFHGQIGAIGLSVPP